MRRWSERKQKTEDRRQEVEEVKEVKKVGVVALFIVTWPRGKLTRVNQLHQ